MHMYSRVSAVYSVLSQCQDPAVCPCTPQGECFSRQQAVYLPHCLLRHYTDTANMRLEGKVANMAGVEAAMSLDDVSAGSPHTPQSLTQRWLRIQLRRRLRLFQDFGKAKTMKVTQFVLTYFFFSITILGLYYKLIIFWVFLLQSSFTNYRHHFVLTNCKCNVSLYRNP